MADLGCNEAILTLNAVFQSALILNDGHEILARLQTGDDPADIVTDLASKFRTLKRADAARVQQVISAWPRLHMEAVGEVLKWALGKLDTDERISISWKGDADNPETVTRFELRGNQLQVEFAHPPPSGA